MAADTMTRSSIRAVTFCYRDALPLQLELEWVNCAATLKSHDNDRRNTLAFAERSSRPEDGDTEDGAAGWFSVGALRVQSQNPLLTLEMVPTFEGLQGSLLMPEAVREAPSAFVTSAASHNHNKPLFLPHFIRLSERLLDLCPLPTKALTPRHPRWR